MQKCSKLATILLMDPQNPPTQDIPSSQVNNATQSSISPPSNRSFLSTKIVLLIGALVVGLIVAGFIYFQTIKSSSTPEITKQVKKDWVGVIYTKEGLVKLSSQGKLEKDGDGKIRTFMPPWLKASNEGTFVPRELLQDGQMVFVGSPKIPSAPKENIIYSLGIDSTKTPKPFLKTPDGQKIVSLAVSPDSKHIAVISVTRTNDQLLEGLEDLEFESEEWKKISAEREKELQEQTRTISIYETDTGQIIRTLKLMLLDPPSRRIGGGRLLWNQTGLFSIDRPEITVFNPTNGEIIDTIPDISTGPGSSLSKTILISPDGNKYFSQYLVKKIPGGEIIGQLDTNYLSRVKFHEEPDIEAEDLENKLVWDGPSIFSSDSEKVLIQGRNGTQTNFVILELDIESGKTIKVGDFEILQLSSIPSSEIKSLFLFLTYNPLADKIFFAANYPTVDKTAVTDLFQLQKGEQKAQLIDQFDDPYVSFLGWYLK